MEFISRWGASLINWWIIVSCASQIHHTYGNFTITKEDLLLLKDEETLKCFTRTQDDFTCFFEAPDNRTYDLLYSFGEYVQPGRASWSGTKECELFTQVSDEGTLLHVCSFPAADVVLYVEMQLRIVERDSKALRYTRSLSVEDHFLLDPPFNVSLNHNGEPGQLQVSWKSKPPEYFEDNMMFLIRHSSTSLGRKTKDVHVKEVDILDSVVPGEVTEVQVTAKCASSAAVGHWSRWSDPVRAMVPQSSGDISLTCFTPDLHNITCTWNTSRYGPRSDYALFYKTSLRGSSWSDWAECVTEGKQNDLCRFQAHGAGRFRVKLCSDPSLLSRTFYAPASKVHKSIRTSPPSHLSRGWRRNKLCLNWEAPLPILFAHLQYEVCYQIRGNDAWMILSIQGPETSTCMKLPLGSHYSAKIRAKATGSIYSGDWSDWSEVVSGDTPADKSTFLLLCIPISMLILAIVAMSLLPKYFGKLKLYFWPPVPNLDKVLQAYLADMNQQRWNPPPTAKPCPEEISPSFLEVMSEYEAVGSEKPSERPTQLPSAEQRPPHPEPPDQPLSAEDCPGYVTLRKGILVHCPKANMYIHSRCTCDGQGRAATKEAGQTCTECPLLCSGNELMNQSYLPQAEPTDGFKCRITAVRESGNLYTNLPCS